MANNTAEIERIEELLRSGVKSVTVDGVTTTIDRVALEKQLRRLRAEDDTQRGRRPVAASVDLSGF